MEFTKDIYFDNGPKAGKESKITYSGSLFQNGSNNVNIVYGFGEAWNNTTTKQMEKADNGFVANIRMRNFDTFNFCFSDNNNNWDNNNGFNYISPILPEVQESKNEANIDFGVDYSTSIDDIIDDILGNTTKQDIINDKENDSIDKILESINTDALPEIEALFNDLFFESVKEDEKTQTTYEVSMEPALAEELKEVGEAVKNMTSTKTNNSMLAEELGQAFDTFENMISTTKVNNSVLAEELGQAYDTFESMTLAANTATSTVDNAELIKLFDELFEISKEPITFESVDTAAEVQPEEVKLNVAAFNLDGLVSELLEPVIASETYADKVDEASLFEDINSTEPETEHSLAIINSGEFTVASRKLGYFYKLRKRIRLAFLKLAKIPKDFVKQLGL